MFAWALLYLLLVNGATVAAFAADKRRAEGGLRRVPEATLLRLAAIGGSPGAFVASELFRHKTRKQPFRATLWTLAGLQLAALGVLAVPQVRDALLAPVGTG